MVVADVVLIGTVVENKALMVGVEVVVVDMAELIGVEGVVLIGTVVVGKVVMGGAKVVTVVSVGTTN